MLSEQEAYRQAEAARKRAWEAYQKPLLHERKELLDLMSALEEVSPQQAALRQGREQIAALPNPLRRDLGVGVSQALVSVTSKIAIAPETTSV